MHQKDFSEWHKIKAIIHHDKERPHFHEREIWFCSLGGNVGFEQDGRGETFLRPVIVLSAQQFYPRYASLMPSGLNINPGIFPKQISNS